MILDIRLRTAADMVPNNARLADIGSDHAYLPIALCMENKIDCALASDINEGPVAAAVANIHKNRLDDRIKAVKADGLGAVKSFEPDCVTVLGMGGELIVSILEKAEWIKDGKITLVLQPMTHPEILAKYLCLQGFSIIDEKIVCDGGRDDRIYRIICARFDGVVRDIGEVDALVGRINLERGDGVTLSYIGKLIRVLETRVKGKLRAGMNAETEKTILDELKKELNRHEGN